MLLIRTFENFESRYSKNLKYHLDNNLSVVTNVFRPKSKEYYSLLSEARELFDRGRLELNASDSRIFKNTDIGRFVKFKKNMVPLDVPIKDEETSTNDETFYIVYVKDFLTKKIKKIKFKNKITKKPSKDKLKSSYWSNRLKKYIQVETLNEYF